MSIFGWKTLEQAEPYTRAARQKMLAGGAMQLVSIGQTVNESDPPAEWVENGGSISA